MPAPILRASLFALAREIEQDSDRVLFSDWTRPRKAREAEASLAENATLNLFLTPRTAEDAFGGSGMGLDRHVEALTSKGLLLSDAEWEEQRAKHPYTNYPSLWADMPAGTEPFESYDEAYARDFAPWNQLPVATDVLSLAPLPGQAGLRLLDVGCGTGHNLRLMEQLGFRCWGIDVSPTAVAKAKTKTATPDNFVAGSVTELPWPDSSFDLVSDIGCLHCLRADEVHEYVAEVRRVLAPGGRFLCRSFKPREEKVLKAQPVKMERLGYSPDEVVSLFSGVLSVQLVKEGPVHGLYLGQA
jgi:2-polyprenyl-3-methyl-5-hydroxy-6-metoxy-1,4-benzoquinol methylase